MFIFVALPMLRGSTSIEQHYIH